MERYTSKYWVTFISKTLGKKIVIYSQLEHHHTNPNESKCIRYKRIGPRLCESVNQERKRGMPHRCREEGGTRTAIEGAETLPLLELAE